MELYEAPVVESAFTAEELDREIVYAGNGGTIFPPFPEPF